MTSFEIEQVAFDARDCGRLYIRVAEARRFLDSAKPTARTVR